MSNGKVSSAIGWIGLQHAVRLAVGLVTSLGLARHLGPAGFGAYQSLVSWVLIFVAVAAGGFQSVVIQQLAVSKAPHLILGTAFRLRMVWSGLAMLLCTGIPLLLGWDTLQLMGLLILVPILPLQVGDLADYLFQSRIQPKPVVVARTCGSLASLALVGFGMLSGQGILFFLLAVMVEQVIGCALLLLANQRSGIPFARWRFDPLVASELWQDAWPMLLATLSFFIYTRIDVVMLQALSTPEQTGFFAASARLSQLWAFVPMVIVNAAFPLLARTRASGDIHAYAEQQSSLFTLLGASGLAIALPVSLCASWLAPLLFGVAYRATAPMLALQAWIALCYFLRTGLDRYLVTERLTRFNLMLHLGTALLNVALNLVLIPRMGGLGAAWASLAAMAAGVWLMPWLHPQTRAVAKRVLVGVIGPLRLLTQAGRDSCRRLLNTGI